MAMSEDDKYENTLDHEGMRLWQLMTGDVEKFPDKEYKKVKKKETKGRSLNKNPSEKQSLQTEHAPERKIKSREVDRATAEKLRRGRIPVDGSVDLHGMTQNEAYAALEQFIFSSYREGRRCLLIITGKGRLREGPDGHLKTGILREKLPQWLEAPRFHEAVLKVQSAHVRHGGAGAYYVLLRKKAKSV